MKDHFLHRLYNMPHHCCVPHCTSDSRQDSCKNLSFHIFPQDEERVKKWIIAIRRDIGPGFKITKGTRVCSLHFTPDAYEPTTPYRKIRRLKKDSVPSVFSWTQPQKSARRVLKRQQLKKPNEKQLNAESLAMEHSYAASSDFPSTSKQDCVIEKNDVETKESLLNSSASSDDSLSNVVHPLSPDKASLHCTNLQLLHIRNKEKFSILRFSNSDKDIRYYTGFASYASLSFFFNFLLPAANFLYYVGTTNTSSGTPYTLVNKRGPSRTLSPMEELFLTLVRLRKGLHQKIIADLYNLSEGHVSKIINTWILFLADRLSYLPIWPSKEHVKKNLPAFFKDFPSTRAIIDCTEIFIEQPSAADCQRETFSSYKHHNTAKGLIVITSNGQISFISPLYSGRCSDKKIARHCGILDLLEEGDGLMADRGFDIEADLTNRGAKLIMPAFLQGQDQFTEEQLIVSRNIAAVRVHVERAVRKMKEFEILSNMYPISMCPILPKVWLICGHLANFTGCGSLFQPIPQMF